MMGNQGFSCTHLYNLPEASFPFAFLVMTTFEETVVGVLAAITTPIKSKELKGTCALNKISTNPNTKKGMMIRLTT
jgi:hypothetical protein